MTVDLAGTPYDDRCCTLDPAHDGPCVWFCSTCAGTGECPHCDGAGPELLGCDACDTTGSCPSCWGAGEFVDYVPTPRPVVTISPAGGVL